jgi:hypothetical protein
MQGRIHHRIGHQNRDLSHLRLAKVAYQKVLAIDPTDEGSLKGLRALASLAD